MNTSCPSYSLKPLQILRGDVHKFRLGNMSNNASIFGNILFNSTLFTACSEQVYQFENCTNIQIFTKGFPLYVESPYDSNFPPFCPCEIQPKHLVLITLGIESPVLCETSLVIRELHFERCHLSHILLACAWGRFSVLETPFRAMQFSICLNGITMNLKCHT